MSKRLYGLDVLRFLAAISVLFYHYCFIGSLEGSWSMNNYFSFAHLGDFGVDVFFVISGFIITSSAKNRTAKEFFKSRFLRIYPAFFICSTITAITSSMLPGVSAKDIFIRWITQFTFYSKIFNVQVLSNVYWTLTVEITFYILVGILIVTGLFKKLNIVVPIWLLISFSNQYILKNDIVRDIFLTQYSGHFVAGMLLYQIKYEKPNAFTPLGFLLSIILIWQSINGIEMWIYGSYGFRYDEISTLLIALTTILIVYFACNVQSIIIPKKFVSILGGMSYTLYLLHADFGFFIRAMFYRVIFVYKPELVKIITEDVILILSIISSLLFAFCVSNFLEGPVRRLLEQTIFSVNRKKYGPKFIADDK
jgi:peptidoglycan/LPS O-acetylase OafA/YrhL